MDLNWIPMFFIWYGLLSLAYVPIVAVDGSASINYDISDDLNTSYNESDVGTDVADVFGGITKFFAFVGFGVGLPDDTPVFFSVPFAIFQSCITLLLIGFIVSSIWDG